MPERVRCGQKEQERSIVHKLKQVEAFAHEAVTGGAANEWQRAEQALKQVG
jgi:hypothetical protein